MSKLDQIDAAVGRFVVANHEAQRRFIDEMRALLLEDQSSRRECTAAQTGGGTMAMYTVDEMRALLLEDRSSRREDARRILRAYHNSEIAENKALDLLGFGRPQPRSGASSQ